MRIWQNPEFVRYARANLRPARLATVIGAAFSVSVLLALAIWSGESRSKEAFYDFFLWMSGIQFAVLGFGCGYCCGQTIVQERLLKTFDFLRTTRLSVSELSIGMLFGAPIQAYVFAGCLAISGIPAALLAGIGVDAILGVYVLLLMMALFASVMGLWISMLGDRGAAGGAVLLVFLLGAGPAVLAESPFPGIAAISPIPAFLELMPDLKARIESASVFGMPVSFLFMTVLLQTLFGFWMMLMVLRNLKKDPAEMRLLTRWQALGFTAFLNLLFYALLASNPPINSYEIVTTAMTLNAIALFIVGLATASPREKLKSWWRGRQGGVESYFSESGLSWPWIVSAAGIAFTLFLAASNVLHNVSRNGQADIRQGAIELGVFLVFIVRDISFLQFCGLTRMRRPFAGGFLYLVFYYAASVVVAVSFSGATKFLLAVLTPYAVFSPDFDRSGALVGGLIQTATAIFLLSRLHARLRRVAALPASA